MEMVKQKIFKGGEKMESKEDNIIICENCYEENEATRKTCKNCGAKLYKNRNTKTEKITENTVSEENEDYTKNNYHKENKVALIIKVIAIVGAVIGVIVSCSMLESSYTEDMAIIGIFASIMGGVFSYALGEIIQKLQNIEDNTKK